MTLARNVALGLGVFAAQCAVAFGMLSLDSNNTDTRAIVEQSVATVLGADFIMLPATLRAIQVNQTQP